MKNPFEQVDTCCGFTSNLAEVCYSGPSDVCYSAPISAGRVVSPISKQTNLLLLKKGDKGRTVHFSAGYFD